MHDDFTRVLAEFGVSPVEYDAFTCPFYHIPLGHRKMASWTVGELDGCRDTFTADEYYVAIEGMIAKDWLCIQGDPSAERERHQAEGFPAPSSHYEPIVPFADVVTFTRRGYLLHRRLLRRKHGLDFVRRLDTLELNDDDACHLRFYARSERQCRDWLEAKRSLNRSSHIEILATTEPEPTGPWRPDRFRVVHAGYLATATYRRVPDSELYRPFNVHGLAVEGKVGTTPPITIRGTVEGLRFQFTDFTASACSPTESSPPNIYWDFTVFGPPGRQLIPGSALSGEENLARYRATRNIVFRRTEIVRNDGAKPLSVDEACRLAEDCLRAVHRTTTVPGANERSGAMNSAIG